LIYKDKEAEHIGSQDYQLLTSWLAVIGMITMYWSPVERSIDQCVHFLHQENKIEKPKPTRLNGKIDLIKKYMPVSIFSADAIAELAALTKQTVQIRDVLVHGVIDSYDQQKMVIGKINGKSDDHLIEMFPIEKSSLDKSAQKLSYLGENWGNLATALLHHTKNA
jgi:hypothetical protein